MSIPVYIEYLLSFIFLTGCGLFDSSDTGNIWFDVDVSKYDHLEYANSIHPNQYYDAFVESGEYDYSELAFYDTILAHYGNLCESDSCLAAYHSYQDSLNPLIQNMCHPGNCNLYAVRIRNDSLFIPRNKTELFSLFKPFNTIEKAAAVAMLNFYWWNPNENTTNLIRPIANGFELIVLTGNGCPSDIRYVQLEINYDGEIKVLRTKLKERGNPNCRT